jgi:putative restriction endonuclease
MSGSIVDHVDKLNVWHRGSRRAPHKPLLLLLALSRFSKGEESLPFADLELPLTELLKEFSPSSSSYHPEYPFWRLQNDGLWEVTSSAHLKPRQSNTDPTRTQLRSGRAVGHLAKKLRDELRVNPKLLAEIAQRLLSSHFPETLHQDILDAVGLSFEDSSGARRSRDSQFRTRVLIAYQFRCALCGLDLRIGNMMVALEAAHIKWHQAGGPDTESNGIALCSLHHKIFDLGASTVQTHHRVLVSELVHGTQEFERVLLQHHGRRISPPLRPEDVPFVEYLEWHRREVFKGRPRPLPSGAD